MISQRTQPSSAIQARAEALPFGPHAFDAVMGVLTVHHWADRVQGLQECARVARRRVVLLTCDPAFEGFWLTKDYLPQFLDQDRRWMPRLQDFAGAFGPSFRLEVRTVPIPRDCIDGFLGAFWARPLAYLDPAIQAGISSFRLFETEEGLDRLRTDLATGSWQQRYGHLLEQSSLDLGYRLVVAERKSRGNVERNTHGAGASLTRSPWSRTGSGPPRPRRVRPLRTRRSARRRQRRPNP